MSRTDFEQWVVDNGIHPSTMYGWRRFGKPAIVRLLEDVYMLHREPTFEDAVNIIADATLEGTSLHIDGRAPRTY